MDFIKNADYLIDLGPEAGENGGRLVGTGTPESIVQTSSSWTGKYLKEYLV
jgi:excinuclease ABC subunit A